MSTAYKNVFELTKMAVHTERRGEGIGQLLIEHCIAFAKANESPSLLLYSHKKLENAIYIYKKYEFKEIPVEKSVRYERANIKMELIF